MSRKKPSSRRSFGSLRKIPSGKWQAAYRDQQGITHRAPMTTVATLVGQPGGPKFNVTDIAVPVIEQPVVLPKALKAVPGAKAAADAIKLVRYLTKEI